MTGGAERRRVENLPLRLTFDALITADDEIAKLGMGAQAENPDEPSRDSVRKLVTAREVISALHGAGWLRDVGEQAVWQRRGGVVRAVADPT